MTDEVETPQSSQVKQFSKAVLGSPPGPHIPPLPPTPPAPPLTADDVPADLLTLSDEDFAEFVRRTLQSPAPFKFPEIPANPVRSLAPESWAKSWAKMEEKLAEKLSEKVGPGPRTAVMIGGRNGVPIREVSSRRCTELPGRLFLKSGMSWPVEEAENLRFAHSVGLPSPKVHRVCLDPPAILMDCIEGDRLSDVWTAMTIEQKKDIAQQLGQVISAMRSVILPPSQGIGACGGGPVRELRAWFDYSGGPFQNEHDFNNEFIYTFNIYLPPAMEKAFRSSLRTDNRIVLTHGDLKAHNVLIKDGKVVGLIDWEFAGWLPEYWEFVHFVRGWHGEEEENKDFVNFVDEIFETQYPEELVAWCAMDGRRPN